MFVLFVVVGIIAAAMMGANIPFTGQNAINPALHPGNDFAQSVEACKPSINTGRIIKIDADPELNDYYVNNPAHNPESGLDFNIEDDEWVLVKENAPIASWKADFGDYVRVPGYDTYSELERVGTAVSVANDSNNPDVNKSAYIGIGWCNPGTGEGFGFPRRLCSEYIDTNGTYPCDDCQADPSNINACVTCDYCTGSQYACLDPIVQDVVFVLNRKGVDHEEWESRRRNYDEFIPCEGEDDGKQDVDGDGDLEKHWLKCRSWGEGNEPYPPMDQEHLNQYWWSFNVYYKASELPANPTYEDLPCWMRYMAESCPGGGDVMGIERIEVWNIPGCEAEFLEQANKGNNKAKSFTNNPVKQEMPQLAQKLLGAQAQEGQDQQRPQLVIKTSFMDIADLPNDIELADYYISSVKLLEAPSDPIIGTAYNDHFNVRLRKGNISGTSARHAIILDPRSINGHGAGYDGPYWLYVPLLGDSKPMANSIQLGSFVPGIPSFFYEWWTPSCKPALYFYPEEETALSVKVEPEGYITKSIPKHGNTGWNIVARPDGTLITDSKQPIPNNYLYYEAFVNNLSVPKDKGWVKHSGELLVFFRDVLPKLGLNKKEQNDFLNYWLPKLTSEGESWYITLVGKEELDRVEPISFSAEPDNFIRVRFYFEKLDDQINLLSNYANQVTSYQLPAAPQARDGFVVVDWGGILGNGSCGEGEMSK